MASHFVQAALESLDILGFLNMVANVLWLCVCLPLAQIFKLPQMLMGQIAQNRCYA
jgi:hypothetical protein